MNATGIGPADSTSSTPDLAANLRSFRLSLDAAGKSPATITAYSKAVTQLAAFVAQRGMPQQVTGIRREHVEAFLVCLRDEQGHMPATVSQRYRSLQQFFKWLVDEGELRESPMARMRPPRVPETPPPVLADEQVKALLATCSGTSFDDRRDAALIRLLADCGIRRAEAAGLRLEDLDWRLKTATVLGKGSRIRVVPFGPRTAQALDRYITRARSNHPHRDLPWLWLGKKGRLTDTGIGQVIKRRGNDAGIAHLHPHLFRHTATHNLLSDGHQEGDVMQLMGWRSRQMLSRYAASTAAARAIEAKRRLSRDDRY